MRPLVFRVHHSEHHSHDLKREPTLLTPPKLNAPAPTELSSDAQITPHEQELENVVSSSSNGSAGPKDNGKEGFRVSVKKRYEPLTDDVESQQSGSRPTSTETRRPQQRTRLDRSLVILRLLYLRLPDMCKCACSP